VLIVDDSLSVRRVLAGVVEAAGWHSVQARDGLEALEYLQRVDTSPDLVLLDIEMPRLDGFELTQALRSQDAYRDVPIVIISSRANEKHRERAASLGATEYLVKPFHEDALLAVMRRLTSGREGAAA
jgi:chemosensory pili system protein ChpA (sensor histidine kinase/response regulator)